MSEHDRELLCPECPSCGAPMRLSVVASQPTGLERRTFECRPCGQTESYLFEVATLPGKPKPIPTMWPSS
jgi:hypothetical protein